MVQGTVCSIWLSSTLMLILLILCTISVMVTPTESSSDFTPLVRPRPENHSSNGSRFVFPNDLEPRIDKTECTPEFPVCSNVFDYPHELINDIVGRQKDRYAEVFGNDVVVESGDKLVQRFDNVDEDGNAFEYICDSEERLIHPKSGFTTDNTSVMIINTKDYMQGVRIETCRRRGEPCEKLSPLFARTECKQVYHYRTLLAIDPKTNQPYKEKFKLPSCCKCVIVPLDGSAYRKKRETDGL
ncbi:protein spaetzle isoform X6 [Ochlerotatus camptorhynchus]|uniref:protein spaetzle isoform X6 n=1 Tax=Ochlerotatus camptorhynchus TaxID=644619 RepID=UPI0031D58423